MPWLKMAKGGSLFPEKDRPAGGEVAFKQDDADH